MKPEVIGELVNAVIPFFVGISATLLGYRVVGKKPGASFKYDDWYKNSALWLITMHAWDGSNGEGPLCSPVDCPRTRRKIDAHR